MAGIQRYRSAAGIDKIPVICVITEESTAYAKEIFRFFKHLHANVQLDIYDIRTRDLSAATSDSKPLFQLAPQVDQLEQFLITLFDLWFYDTSGQVDFKELRDEVKMVLQPQLDLGAPYDKRRCDIQRTIFDPNGHVYSCDQYINNPQTALGNITTDEMEEMIHLKIRLWEKIKQQIRHAGDGMACSTCRWGRQCSGGCISCMKYNSKLARARSRGLQDADWIDMPQDQDLADIAGEFYYCDALRALRKHVEQSIARQMSLQ
jgi:radical SAM protein with 4Fe4S-binding SPASM domain